LPDPGTILEGKYEILGTVRESETGAIYKVRHVHLDEVRILKAMRRQGDPGDETGRRFFQEARTLTHLRHPNICSILDLFQDAQGTSYIVLEYIDGVNISELLEASGTPSLPLALEVTHQTLLALECLHRRNIVHRDIAPDNIMLALDENGQANVKVIGLGFAKSLTSTVDITGSGSFVGKMKYSSPEQLGALEEGEKLDGRSDLYSLGVVLYQMLTGILPIRGDRPRQILVGHLFLPPIPFIKSDPEGKVPQEVAGIVLKALEKKRDMRFPSAEEFDKQVVSLRGRLATPADSETTKPLTIGEAWRAPSAPTVLGPRPVSAALKRDSKPVVAEPTPAVKPAAPVAPPQPPKAEPASSKPSSSWKRERFRLAIGGTAAVVTVIGVLIFSLLSRSRADTRPRASTPVATPPAVAAPAFSPQPIATTTAVPSDSAAIEAPTPVLVPPGSAAEQARLRMAAARSAADAEEAAARAPNTYRLARQKEGEALVLFGRGEFSPAGEAFLGAEQLFEKARESSTRWKREAVLAKRRIDLAPAAPVPTIAGAPPRAGSGPAAVSTPAVLVRPVLVRGVGPSYPGSDTLPPGPDEIVIVVEAVVTESGEVRDAQVAHVQHLALDRAAISAVSNWLFRPATVNGNPVPVRIKVTSILRRTKNPLGNRLKEVSREAETIGLAVSVPSQAAQ
jgi:serine/threonine-protein kinase